MEIADEVNDRNNFIVVAVNDTRDISITQDHNRAAAILWLIGSETPNEPARPEFLKKLATKGRELNGTHLITAAMNTAEKKGPYTRILSDPPSAVLDVLGANEIHWLVSGLARGRHSDAGGNQITRNS